MAKIKETALVESQTRLADDVYSMWIKTETITAQAEPGQFVDVFPKDGAKLLPRPISICETDKEKGLLRLVYRQGRKKSIFNRRRNRNSSHAGACKASAL